MHESYTYFTYLLVYMLSMLSFAFLLNYLFEYYAVYSGTTYTKMTVVNIIVYCLSIWSVLWALV